MKFEDYICTRKPLYISGILFPFTLLVPILTVVFEGWHSGVPYGVFFAVQIAILMPGIYLIRPLVFWIWMSFCCTANIVCAATLYHYWTSCPDWMDAEVPKAVLMGIATSMWLNQIGIVMLGCFGWFKYFRRSYPDNSTVERTSSIVP
jgi:hypothetical protein